MRKLIKNLKYFGYLSPSFRIVEIVQLIFLGVISNSDNIYTFCRFLIIASILAVISSIVIHKIDGKGTEEVGTRNPEAIQKIGFNRSIDIPKPFNFAFWILIIVDTFSIIAAGYNIIHEMQKAPSGDNWLSRHKNMILYIIASILGLALISKFLNTFSLQNRDVYKYYEELIICYIFSKQLSDNNIVEEYITNYFNNNADTASIMKNFRDLEQGTLEEKKILAYKLALLKENDKEIKDFANFLKTKDSIIKELEIDDINSNNINQLVKSPMEENTIRTISTDYNGYINITITSLLITLYSIWIPAIIPNLPTYVYAIIGVLISIVLITQISNFLNFRLGKINRNREKFKANQDKIRSSITINKNAQNVYIINIDKAREKAPFERIMPIVVIPIFNFLAIAFPIGYVVYIITKALHLPAFYASPGSAIIMALITIPFASMYSYFKTKGARLDMRNEAIINAAMKISPKEINGGNNAVQHRNSSSDNGLEEEGLTSGNSP